MRKRNVQILFRLNPEEAEKLNQKVRASGLSREDFLRTMIEGYRLHEKPGAEFYAAMRGMSAIGNNLNQLAARANKLGFVDALRYEQEAKVWRDFQLKIKEQFLLPEKT